MFKVLFITFFGVGLGFLLRSAAWLKYLSKSITYTIWLLLFFFGLQVGANDLVVNNLDTLGVKALIIAAAGSLGSCVAAWAVWKGIFKGNCLGVGGISETETIPGQNPDVMVEVAPNLEADETTGPEGMVVEQGVIQGAMPGENVNSSGSKLKGMLGGVTVVAFFAVGCICGWLRVVPQFPFYGEIAMYVLYALMVQVGMSIGSDRKLKEIILGLNPKFLFLPLGTIVGTLVFAAVASIFISDISLPDSLAIGAGFGYYSLSSVLITQIKEATVGGDMAAQLGTIALMSNIMREVITLLFAPVICKVFGKLAPISTGGATSMDSTLPVITAVCGKELVFISIFHGVLVDFSVPFLVTFFASM